MSDNLVPEITYLALGDSYTIGEGVPETDRWGVHLADLLRERGVPTANPHTIARTGWTTSELSVAIAEANLQKNFDLVSLLIGVNNQYRGQSVETFREEFRQLLETAVAFANQEAGHVLVLSIPDWGVTPFAEGRDRARIAAEIDAHNQVVQVACQEAGVAFIDITTLTRAHGTDTTYLASDSLHYAGKMHLEWATLALPVALQILR